MKKKKKWKKIEYLFVCLRYNGLQVHWALKKQVEDSFLTVGLRIFYFF